MQFVARVGSAKLPYISYCIQKLFSGNQTKVPVSCTRPSLDFSHSFLETCVMHRVRKLLLKHGYQYVPLPELWPFRSRSLLPFVESRWLTEKGGVLCSYRTPLIPLMQLDLPRVGSCRLSERGVVRAALVLRRKDGCASRLECLEGIFPFLSDLLGIYQDWSLTVCFPKLAVHLMHQLFAVGIRLPGLAAHLCSLIHEISHARTRRRHDRLVYALQVFHLILQMSNKAEPFLPHRETLSDYALKWLGSGGQLSPRALLSSFVDLGLPIFVTCGDLTLENLATSSLRWSKAVIELNSGAQGAVAKTVDAVKDAISVLGLPSFKIHCRLLTPEALLDPRVNVESCSMYCAVHSGDTVVCAGGQLAPSFSAEVAEVGPETTDWPYRPQNRTFTTVDEVAFFLDFILDARSTRLAEDHSLQKLWSPYCVVLSQHEDLLPLAFELLHKLRSSGIRVAQLPAPCFDISFVRQSLRSAGVNLMAVVMRKKREEDLQFRIESLISQEEAVYSTSVEMAVMDVLRRLKGERAERLSEVEV
ncbi:MAG: uncharacterized protein KVP18_000149 [Porospora cf. gigantea A]|uniref:uncharacterized protein n=1 Tax=Porospora cf. gigantea A TaxID=2853593 RepID=UPI00355953A9|nr:MAG: hypothetical protein KVP18_000149 [Porospora cf. gigantea A]